MIQHNIVEGACDLAEASLNDSDVPRKHQVRLDERIDAHKTSEPQPTEKEQ
jgi:hypothetical protein